MAAYLQRVFRVLPEETGKLVLFAGFAALLQAGVAVGMTTADSLFFTHLGAEKLPVVYLGMPVVMAIYAPVYSLLLGRLGMDRMVQLTLAVLVVGGVFFGASDNFIGESTPWLLFAMKFYVGLWFIALYTLFWNFADDYYSILDGKRLYCLIAAGGAAGATAGAALVTALSRVVAPGKLFFAWSVLALLTAPVVVLLRRRFPRVEVVETDHEGATSPSQLLRFAIGVFRKSRFALTLAGACFCAVNLAAILEFLSMGVFAHGKTPAELAQLLGPLYAIANVLTLFANLFVYSRLVGRIGVGNTALVLPLAFLAAFVGFYLHPGFLAAVIGFYAYQSLLASIDYNNINLLFNAMPTAAKRPLRTFIEAMTEPVATALAGVFLLAWASPLGVNYVALAGLCACLVAIVVGLMVRHGYGLALADNLRRDWLDFNPAPEFWQRQFTEADRALLRDRALHSHDRGERITATDLLGYVADPQAGNALTNLVGSARPAEAELLRPAINRILRGNDTATVAQVLLWLESERSPEDPELLDEFVAHGALPVRHLRAWRHSRHPARVAMSAVARWHGANIEDAGVALAEVHHLLVADQAARRWGVRALGGFRHAPHARALYPFLEEADTELRLETLRALHKLTGPDTEGVLARVLPLLADSTPDERQLILGIAAKVRSVAALDELLVTAKLFSVAESRQLESLIVDLGPRAIATVIHVLRNPTISCRSRTIGAHALGRIARPQLELIADDLMVTELKRATELALTAELLASGLGRQESDGVAVLRRFYRDAANEGLNYVLQLLGLTNRLPEVDLIQASLTFSSQKNRANAIESIEQSCPRRLFDLLRPLLPANTQSASSQPPGDQPPPSWETLLRRASSSEDGLECAAALLAFDELALPGGGELLRRRIDKSEAGRVTASLAALLPRFEPALRATMAGHLHVVERVAALVRASPFAEAPIAALEFLASRSHERAVPEGTILYDPRQPTGDLFVVATGSLELVRPEGSRRLDRGGVCNERSLTGTLRDEQALSLGCTVLAIPVLTVARAIEIFPALGMSLFKTKIVHTLR